MKQESFVIRAYGKSELAMMYFPDSSKDAALKRLKNWFRINPRLKTLIKSGGKNFTPKQVQQIVDEVGEPY